MLKYMGMGHKIDRIGELTRFSCGTDNGGPSQTNIRHQHTDERIRSVSSCAHHRALAIKDRTKVGLLAGITDTRGSGWGIMISE